MTHFTLNRLEELMEEIADCNQASKDCRAQGCYREAARLAQRAKAIQQKLDLAVCRTMWAEKQQLTLDEIMAR